MFVLKESDSKYHLGVHTYTCGFKEGMQQMVDECGIKGVFLGTRRGDPNCKEQVWHVYLCSSFSQHWLERLVSGC